MKMNVKSTMKNEAMTESELLNSAKGKHFPNRSEA